MARDEPRDVWVDRDYGFRGQDGPIVRAETYCFGATSARYVPYDQLATEYERGKCDASLAGARELGGQLQAAQKRIAELEQVQDKAVRVFECHEALSSNWPPRCKDGCGHLAVTTYGVERCKLDQRAKDPSNDFCSLHTRLKP